MFDELKSREHADINDEKPINPKEIKRLKIREAYQHSLMQDQSLDALPQKRLMGFDGGSLTSIHDALPFTFADYLALVDNTARVIRDDKRGYISADSAQLNLSMGLDGESWIEQVKHFEACFGSCAGGAEQMAYYANRFGRKWSKGVRTARRRAA